MKAYKGFNKDMTCRGFQYKEGETYETDKAELCESGFHACLDPIDCFGYYAPGQSVFREVELDDVSEKRGNDSKIVAKKIKIGAEVSIAGIVKAHVEYVNEHIVDTKKVSNDKDYSAATNTGDASAATNTGKGGVAIVTGYKSKAKGAVGSAICVCERGDWNGEEYPLLAIKAAIIDGEVLKANTFYMLVNGEFVEAQEYE